MATECIEYEALKIEMSKTQDQITNLRRGLFGRYDTMVHHISELQNYTTELQHEVQKLKNCIGNNSKETLQKNILLFPNVSQVINDC